MGLDQRLRTWEVLHHSGSEGLTIHGIGGASTSKTAFSESSSNEADACAPVSDDLGMGQASMGGQASEHGAATASRTGVNFETDEASSCSPMSMRETGSIVLQVLEPSALHVSHTAGDRPSWTVAVVGRGTQIVLCSAEDDI